MSFFVGVKNDQVENEYIKDIYFKNFDDVTNDHYRNFIILLWDWMIIYNMS